MFLKRDVLVPGFTSGVRSATEIMIACYLNNASVIDCAYWTVWIYIFFFPIYAFSRTTGCYCYTERAVRLIPAVTQCSTQRGNVAQNKKQAAPLGMGYRFRVVCVNYPGNTCSGLLSLITFGPLVSSEGLRQRAPVSSTRSTAHSPSAPSDHTNHSVN